MCLRVLELFLLGGIREEVVGSFFFFLNCLIFCFVFFFPMKALCGIYDFYYGIFYFGFQISHRELESILLKEVSI